jgi:hypothetical protein
MYLCLFQPGGLTESSRGLARDVFWPTPGRDCGGRRTPAGVQEVVLDSFRHPCRGASIPHAFRGYATKHPSRTPGYFPSALRAGTTETTMFLNPSSGDESFTLKMNAL